MLNGANFVVTPMKGLGGGIKEFKKASHRKSKNDSLDVINGIVRVCWF